MKPKNRSSKSYISLVIVPLLFLPLTLSAQVTAVEFGGDYSGSDSNADKTGYTLENGDFDAEADSADRRGFIAFGTLFKNIIDANGVGNNNVIYHGTQLTHLDSTAADPAIGIFRFQNIDATGGDALQCGSDITTAVTQQTFAPHVVKSDFLNGADSSGSSLAFENAADSVTFSLTANTGVSTVNRALVKSSGNWYVSTSTSANDILLSINGLTEMWIPYAPDTNIYLSATTLAGTAVAGSTLTDIQAFGAVIQQDDIASGQAKNDDRFSVTGFSARMVITPGGETFADWSVHNFFSELSAGEIQQIRADAEQRKTEFFTSQSGEPLDPREIIVDWNDRGDFTRHWNQDIVMFSMRAFELNEMLDTANDAVQEMCQYHLDRPQTLLEIHSFPTVTSPLFSMCRFYGPNGTRAAGRMTPETYAKVMETIWEWSRAKSDFTLTEVEESQTWWITDSENHHAQHWVTCWGFSQLLKDEPLYQNQTYDDGRTPQEHYDAWTVYLREYLFQRITKGMLVEIDSPSYGSVVLKCVNLLYSFSDDVELKTRADQFLSLFWSMWAEQQIDSVCGGAKTRCYSNSAQGGTDFLNRIAWYKFGVGSPEFRHTSMLPAVLSSWQMPETVLNLVLAPSGRGNYEVRQRRMGLSDDGEHRHLRPDFGGILRYSWCTPDFMMSSLMAEARPSEDWVTISSQNRWSGAIFRGHPSARIYPFVTPTTTSEYNGFWSAQSKGTLISQKLRTSKNANEWNVWFSKDGVTLPETEGNWLFCESTNAYAAVCVVDGGFSSLTEGSNGRWLTCSNEYSPVILEVAQKSAFSNAAAFRSAVLALPVSGDSDSTLTYTGLSGDQFVFYTDQSRLAKINGETIDLAPDKVYDSPYVQGDFGAGTVTVQYGGSKTIIDTSPFANEDRTVALWHFDEVLQDASGSYYADDVTNASRSSLDAREHVDSTNTISIIPDGKFGNALRCEMLEGDQVMMTGSGSWPADQGTFRYQGWIRLQPGDAGGFLFHVYDQVYLSVDTSTATFKINKSGVAADASETNVVECSAAISTSNEWQYIEAIYDGAMLRLVTEQETVTVPGIGEFIPNVRNIYIGSEQNRFNYVGELDEVRISTSGYAFVPDPLNYDGDSLPDEWEITFWGSVQASDGTGDADGDGFIDVDEYRAGTVPTDPNSRFKITSITMDQGTSESALSWQAITGKSYYIQYNSSLLDSEWTTIATGIPGVEPHCTYIIVSGGARAFYRVGVEN
ncbi:MAG: hypothetical protein OSA84_12465 [Akkermansiaceae bacterium]|nr:hypothetical protein [Akkermansiaceae bacterium]